jgi:hypothetical protein
MQLMPDNATAVVQLALASARDADYPNYSSQLKGKGKFELKDENDNVRITLTDFVPVATRALQSTDFSESVWVLGGTRSQACKVQFAGIESPFPNFMKDGHDHYFWGGELKGGKPKNEGDVTLLKLSHADVLLDATEGYTKRVLAMGPSGFDNTNSIMNWVIDQGSWMIPDEKGQARRYGANTLKAMTLQDLRRGTRLTFFGDDGHGKAQVGTPASGAVFLLLGTCSRLDPGTVAEIARLGSEGVSGLHTLVAGRELRVLPRSCADTTKGCSEDDAKGDNTLFEGIAAWDLAARRAGSDFHAATPILL